MKNSILSLPSDFTSELPPVKTATFQHSQAFYTFAPEMDSLEFMEKFPDHRRLCGMLESSGSSWCEKAFLFATVDCFDPPQYIQFGSSFEDAYESFCDNEPSLAIAPEDMKDYGEEPDLTCSFDSNGQPIDTDNVQGFGPLFLVAVTF